MSEPNQRSVALLTLGCARNEVDSEELAARLGDGGWTLTDGPSEDADIIVVNTCGFIDSAKKDSIDTVLAAADTGKKVVAVGCLAERYGNELAASLPEADAVLGFDSYADIAARLDDVAAGRAITPHTPKDRRLLLPVAPAHRPAAAAEVALPGHAWLPSGRTRTRLDDSPVAYLKLASGCDRRCSFCAIPSFRGAFVSRPPAEVMAEARWLAESGAREIVLVSENSTSYGKDLGDLRTLERLLPELADIEGIDRLRVAYLQPAELRPTLMKAIAGTPGVAPYFDLSFQHSSATVLRRMRRFGSTESFLQLLAQARELAPTAGARSNIIVGFPGETEDDVDELESFLTQARLDVVGVFGYSDEDGTDAIELEGKIDADTIAERVERLSAVVAELISQRAEDRIGEQVEVLVEQVGAQIVGRAAHQGPDVDGNTLLLGYAAPSESAPGSSLPSLSPVPSRGQMVTAEVVDTDGADLIATVIRP